MIEKIREIVKPAAEDLGYELYYVEYVKEDGENYLRIYIDNEVGINLTDCEKVSRKISSILDEYDPIEEHYILEVSSPGIERVLFTDEHLAKYLNYLVNVNLKNKINNEEKAEGKLLSYDEDFIGIQVSGKKLNINRKDISQINLKGDF